MMKTINKTMTYVILFVILGMTLNPDSFHANAQEEADAPTVDSTEYRRFRHITYYFLIWSWDAIYCDKDGGSCLPEVEINP